MDIPLHSKSAKDTHDHYLDISLSTLVTRMTSWLSHSGSARPLTLTLAFCHCLNDVEDKEAVERSATAAWELLWSYRHRWEDVYLEWGFDSTPSLVRVRRDANSSSPVPVLKRFNLFSHIDIIDESFQIEDQLNDILHDAPNLVEFEWCDRLVYRGLHWRPLQLPGGILQQLVLGCVMSIGECAMIMKGLPQLRECHFILVILDHFALDDTGSDEADTQSEEGSVEALDEDASGSGSEWENYSGNESVDESDEGSSGSRPETGSETSSSIAEPTVLPNLQLIRICTSCPVAPLLDRFCFPALKSITIDEREFYQHGTPNVLGFSTPDEGSSLVSMLARSQCPLEELYLFTNISASTLMRILELTQTTLRRLTLFQWDSGCLDEAVLIALTRLHAIDGTTKCLCPNLEHLALRYCTDDKLPCGSLANMIESRVAITRSEFNAGVGIEVAVTVKREHLWRNDVEMLQMLAQRRPWGLSVKLIE